MFNFICFYSNDSQRKQFGELFALMEEEEEISATKSRLQGRGRKPASGKPSAPSVGSTKRQIARDLTDSSEESSEVSILMIGFVKTLLITFL